MSENDNDPQAYADKRGPSRFDPERLGKSLIALPLLEEMDKWEERENKRTKGQAGSSSPRLAAREEQEQAAPPLDVIIDINLDRPVDGDVQQISEAASPMDAARLKIFEMIGEITKERGGAIQEAKSKASRHYVFASLYPSEIRELARLDLAKHTASDPDKGASMNRTIHRIWFDHEIELYVNKSISTVKADAARTAFGALGDNIVWAVLDTGVDGEHPHFKTHGTLDLKSPLYHADFATKGLANSTGETALQDESGHGTHVAGIIAGQFEAGPRAGQQLANADQEDRPGVVQSKWKRYQEDGKSEDVQDTIENIEMSGMAPKAKILSLKVLDDKGAGKASNIIAALEYVNKLNSYGRLIKVQGVNLSVGYGFDPAWYACGQSPMCVEVNRLVRMGVVVVTAAGNTGYGYNNPTATGPVTAGLNVTINDPGNAELAITVGSTHRDEPHTYGVSYFSSKGPTGDGRLKPDLVAPGEKILSCETNRGQSTIQNVELSGQDTEAVVARYIEDSGTSMAAPHVSGVIAAFLSARREFIGDPLAVKKIFVENATDLNREPYFQGKGLVDLMRSIQSV